MSSTKLVVILPGLANVLEQQINTSVIPYYLAKTINKSAFQKGNTGLTRLLLNHFSQTPMTGPDLPILSIMSEKKWALRADPCYLHPDRDRLLLFADDLEITTEESMALIAEIQPLLEEFSGELICHQPEQWLLNLKSMPDVTFSALPEVSGKSVEPFLPIGAAQRDWIRLWNEIQMQLYDCDINEQRVNDGKLPINSIWFWGAGEFVAKDKPWSTVQGQNPLLNNLSEQSNSPIYKTSDYSPTSLVAGDNLWLLNDIDTEADWQQQLQQLDKEVFEPLWQCCKTAKIANVQLQIPDHGQYQLSPFDCWKFW